MRSARESDLEQRGHGRFVAGGGGGGFMTTIYYEFDADPTALEGQSLAVVGYGNQGRSWALNLRDSGIDVRVCAREDASREQARQDGFAVGEIEEASRADVACLLVPDDAIPGLPLERQDGQLTLVASGYAYGFDRFLPPGDLAMVAPRMLGPEVRACYEEGVGFITAVGVHRDSSGRALARTLAVARALGGLRQGGLALTPKQEAILDLAVEQVLSPALARVSTLFTTTLLEQGIPLEAVMTELVLSGEVERTYGLVRKLGYTGQFDFHSPASQYGQLSRRDAYDPIDLAPIMRRLTEDIVSGRFADEWDAESAAGHPRLRALKSQFVGPAVAALEKDLRHRLGPGASARQGPRSS
ncbi:MAG: ketol-acid reductoisomerase [Myxococcota bacterium]